jgi:hypothetical protein
LIVANDPASAHVAKVRDAFSVFLTAKAVFVVYGIIPERRKLTCFTAVFVHEAVV